MQRRAFLQACGLAAVAPALGRRAAAAWQAGDGTLVVAAASDLQFVMPLLLERFRRHTGLAARVTYGSSGHFYAQIQNGAPFDLFYSADVEYPRRLADEGLVEPGSLLRYATGRLVLWASRARALDVTAGLAVLAQPGVRRVAIAHPDHAPYGRAAVAALRHEGLYERVQPKLIRGENVAQAAQFAESGNADAGLIALSLALTPRMTRAGVFHEIPSGFHPAIEQGAALVRASRRKDAARRLLAFCQTPEALELLARYGFTRPGAADR